VTARFVRVLAAIRQGEVTSAHQSGQLFRRVVGKNFSKAVVQVIPDEALQVFERKRLGEVPGKRLLDSAADIHGIIQQSSIQVEQINRKRRYDPVRNGPVKRERGAPLRRDPADGDRRRLPAG